MLNLIRENIIIYDVEIYAYCIMSNHFHLLIRADLEELASFMAKILAEFAKYYNTKHNRIGYVFQGRYNSQCVENIDYFWNCLRYIHNNPLCIDGVMNVMDYEYSSMKELYYGEKDILPDTIFQFVAERFVSIEVFLEFHQTNNWDVFEDTPEEEMQNKLRIAKEVLEKYKEIYQAEAIEILDYVKTRNAYKQEMSILLNVSKREANDIVKEIRRQIEGTG